MIDLRWTELSFGLSLLFNFSFILYIVLFFRNSVFKPSLKRKKINYWQILFSLYLIIFVSTSSSSDWYHYQDMVWNYNYNNATMNYGEPIYKYIISFVDKNYFLFRIVVWGGAFLLSCLSFKRFGIRINTAVFFLIAVFLVRYNYTRATFAMAFFFLGFSIMIIPFKRYKVVSFILALLLFYCAYELHRSMLPVLLLTIAAFLPFEKPYIVIPSMIALPILSTILSLQFSVIDSMVDDDVADKLNKYLERDTGTATFYGVIAEIIMYSTFLIPFIIDSVVVLKNRKRNIITPIKRLYSLTVTITLFATLFLFMGLLSTVFTYRYLFMTSIPLTILTVYFFQHKLMSERLFRIIILCGAFSNLYFLLYGLYRLE